MKLDIEFSGLPPAEAAFYARVGLQLDVITLPDISEWVDEVLLREDEPTDFFVGLYRLVHTAKPEVPGFLAHASEESFSVRPCLGWLQQQLAAGEWSLGQLIRSLYRLRTLVESDREVGWIYGLAADYERAAEGAPELMPDLYQETQAFLACYQDYTFQNRAQWLYLDAVLEQRLASLLQ
ncbi:hypothetical protein GCM10027346_28120 [Hymenobacter seoulensis]